jgi:hypothetical protein
MLKPRNIKRIILSLLFVVVVLTFAAMLTSFTLVKTGDRQKTYILPQSLKAKVEQDTRGMDIEQIINYGLTLTASRLRFSRYNDIDMGKANCVGYAQLCASICNQALSANGINGQAEPVVGYIESNGINWCDVLNSVAPKDSYKNFVKDHDFVELVTESKTYYFDPSIYDVLGKKCLKITN